MKTGVFRMYLIAAAWAIMGAIISLVIIVDHSSEPPWLSIIFDMGIAIIVLFTGRIAKRQEMSPWKTGSIAGGIYPVRRKTLLFRAGIEGARRQAKVFRVYLIFVSKIILDMEIHDTQRIFGGQ